MSKFSFNINQIVEVKLYERGYHVLAEDNNSYVGIAPGVEYRTPQYYEQEAAKNNGYTSFQMWDFMKLFGGILSMGQPNYFNLDIVFKSEDLTPID